MSKPGFSGTFRFILALFIPVAAYILQLLFWSFISPYAWFLFFPTVFFSSWIGGRVAGLFATGLSAVLVWWTFMPPLHR